MGNPVVATLDQVPHPRAWGYEGVIANVMLRLAVSEQTPFEEVTAPVEDELNTAMSPEDVRAEVGRRYSLSVLSGGAGLDLLHAPDRPDDAATRFWSSKGVDVFRPALGEPYTLQLLHEILLDQSSANNRMDLVSVDGTLYYLDGASLKEYPATTLYTSAATPFGSTLRAMGNSLYLVENDGLKRFDSPYTAVTATISSTVYDEIWAAKDRIIATVDNTVLEVVDGTSDITLITLPPDDYATDVIDVGPALLVLTTTGSAYMLTIDPSNPPNLILSGQTNFSKQEIPVVAAESQGVVGIATTAPTEAGGRIVRFYTAVVTSSPNQTELQDINLVFTVGSRSTTVDLTPHFAHGTRDSIYLAVDEEGASEVTLWRYYLPTAGYARYLTLGTTANPTSMVELDDRAYVGVAASGVWKEADTYVTDGYVIGPLADHFTADSKQWITAQLDAETLPADTRVRVYGTVDPSAIKNPTGGGWVLMATLRAGQRTTEAAIISMSGRYHAMKIELESDTAQNSTPALHAASVRSVPNPTRDVIYRIPVNISDQFERPNVIPYKCPGRGELYADALRQLEGTQVPLVVYSRGIDTYVLVERIETLAPSEPKVGSSATVMYLTVRGQRTQVGSGEAATAGYALGLNDLGLAELGVGEEWA